MHYHKISNGQGDFRCHEHNITEYHHMKKEKKTNLLGYVFAFDHDIGEGCFEESVPSVEKNASQSE